MSSFKKILVAVDGSWRRPLCLLYRAVNVRNNCEDNPEVTQ